MRSTHVFVAASAAVVSFGQIASADLYTDPVGDQGPSNGNLDIVEVGMSNDDSNLRIDIRTNEFADWTKYLVFLDYRDGGATGNNNPWFRNVEMGDNGIDAFAGVWVDGGGGMQLFTDEGGSWSGADGGSVDDASGTGNTVSLLFSLEALGIGFGDVIKFDIGTSGGNNGDPATDLISVGSTAASWGGQATAGELRSYTVVPAPGTLALLGVAGGLAMRRRRA